MIEYVDVGVIKMVHITGKYNKDYILNKQLGTHNNYALIKELLV